ncbi:glycosyltransferase family 4 protein [Trichothermofontia sp.]
MSGILFCVRSTLHLLRHASQTQVLLLTTAPPFLQILGYGIHRLLGLPYVCLLYDLYPDIITELGILPEKNLLIQLWRGLNAHIWQQAAAIVVLSDTMKQRLTDRHPELTSKINVIHNWADPILIKPIDKHTNWFAQTHDLVDPFVVLYSGNTGRCHDLETLLEAAKLLRQESIKFVFIGGGTQYQACQERVRAWQLDKILFLPYQDKSVLPYSLTACDLSIVSIGLGMEGLVVPSKLYSALAAGRPIAAICEGHSYLKSLFHEANCGRTFQHGDSQGLADFIRQLNDDRALATQLG